MTEYINRLVVVATAGNVNAINNTMQRIYGSAGLQVMGKDLGLHSNPNATNASHYWFSTVYKNSEIETWKDLVGDFGAVEVWTWNMYGSNTDLAVAWSGVSNTRIESASPDSILTTLGLYRVKG